MTLAFVAGKKKMRSKRRSFSALCYTKLSVSFVCLADLIVFLLFMKFTACLEECFRRTWSVKLYGDVDLLFLDEVVVESCRHSCTSFGTKVHIALFVRHSWWLIYVL